MNKPRNPKITKEEIINWFCNLYNSCYPVTHKDYPQSIFMFYDTQFIRKIKLCKISGLPITLPSKVTGICLFEQDWKNNRFYYKYDEVYYFLYKNYSTTHNNISTFIKDRLNEYDKLNVLVPIYCGNTVKLILTIPWLSEYYKLNELMVMESTLIDSNEDGKLGVLIHKLAPHYRYNIRNHKIKEIYNMKVLTFDFFKKLKNKILKKLYII